MNRIEILSNLWIGYLSSSNNEKYNNICNIKILIDCEKDINFLGNHQKYNSHISNNIYKYEILKMYEYLVETTDFIYKNLINNNGIFIFCKDLQKSSTVILAYIIKYGNVDKETAIEIIKSKCNIPELKYLYSLEMFEKNISV